jgi:hypothetical protein
VIDVGGGGVDVEVGESLLLALARLVVLEPVEDVLALDLAVLAQHGGDALDLLRRGRPDAAGVVELLEDPELLRRRRPPRPARPAHGHAGAPHAHVGGGDAFARTHRLLLLLHCVLLCFVPVRAGVFYGKAEEEEGFVGSRLGGRGMLRVVYMEVVEARG